MKTNVYPLDTDSFYHIYNRGINGEKIFFLPKNYFYFLKLLKEKISTTAEIYVYCLASNHFHLLIKTKSEKEIRQKNNNESFDISKIISQKFSNTFNSYTQAINKQELRTGKLFELPFRRKLLKTQDHLINSIQYIHNNPKKHNISDDIISYPYSSFLEILNKTSLLIDTEKVISLFEDIENFSYANLNFKNY
ncbi:transposase [Chryseobacterium sp. POL2]|uniref:transposase n=1 Tax=Chryseobacterium sp. POL2 TaxID=2713414 RepID=UPI001627C9AC|nr:transposase [Chryseobacterium sp. POL2]